MEPRVSTDSVRILIADDSLAFRAIVKDALERIPDVEIVGVAPNGRSALEKLARQPVDLLTLDLEMPELDGLGVLKALAEQKSTTRAIVLSAFSERGSKITLDALRAGAFDFVLKPRGDNLQVNADVLHSELAEKIAAFRRANTRRPAATASTAPAARTAGAIALRPKSPVRVIAIAVSTGGPVALTRVIPALPKDLPVPVLIVQHMPPMFTRSLADSLNTTSALAVSEAAHGDLVTRGRVLIAPGGRQMRVDASEPNSLRIELTDDPPEQSCRPSADYLFRSLAQTVGSGVLGLVMTGMGADGAAGAKLLKARGATIAAQDEATCVVWGMPRAVTDAGLADAVLPLDEIAVTLARCCAPQVRA